MDGLYLLWWVQEKAMSPALVAATMAAGDLLLMALEVPTGWFADRFGNRRSLILGSLLQVAGMICCWRAEGIPGLVGACLLVAIADAFRSGADQALLYRTCVAIDREPEFQRIEARSRAIQVVALALLIVAGGAVVTRWGFAAGWIAETLLCALGCAIAVAMIEPPAHEDESEETRTVNRRDDPVDARGRPHPSPCVSRRGGIDGVVPDADDRRPKSRGGHAARRALHAVQRGRLRSSRCGCHRSASEARSGPRRQERCSS